MHAVADYAWIRAASQVVEEGFDRCRDSAGINPDLTWSDCRSASNRLTASVAGDLLRISRVIQTDPREAERTRQACEIRTR